MKKLVLINLISIVFFILTAGIFGQVKAAQLEFDKQTATIYVGGIVEVGVKIDSGSNQISSTDAYVLYDPGLLEVLEITPGAYFPTVVSNITAGRLYIAGLVDDAATSKTGTGIVANIKFRGLSKGEANLGYDCQQGVYNSSKIIQNDIDATNIIDCTASGTSIISIITPGTGTDPNNPDGSNSGINTYSGNGSGSSASGSALPNTGIFENISKVAVPGMILLLVGGALRLIL